MNQLDIQRLYKRLEKAAHRLPSKRRAKWLKEVDTQVARFNAPQVGADMPDIDLGPLSDYLKKAYVDVKKQADAYAAKAQGAITGAGVAVALGLVAAVLLARR